MSTRRTAIPAALGAVLLAVATPVAAHHILGIPHYRYGDEYPQIPYMEVMAQVGGRELVFTHFPGFPDPGQRVRFKLYIRDRETGRPFRQPLKAEIVRRRFLGGAEPALAPLVIRPGTGPERNDYKFFLTFDSAEAYEVRVHVPTPEGVEVIPFPVVIGRTDDRPLIFGAAALLLGAVAAVGSWKGRGRLQAARASRRRGPSRPASARRAP